MLEQLKSFDQDTLVKYLLNVDSWVQLELYYCEQFDNDEIINEIVNIFDEMQENISEELYEEIFVIRDKARLKLVNELRNKKYIDFLLNGNDNVQEIINNFADDILSYAISTTNDKYLFDLLSDENIMKHFNEIKEAIINQRYTSYLSNINMRKIMNKDLEIARISIKKSFRDIPSDILKQISEEEIIKAIKNYATVPAEFLLNNINIIKLMLNSNYLLKKFVSDNNTEKVKLLTIISNNPELYNLVVDDNNIFDLILLYEHDSNLFNQNIIKDKFKQLILANYDSTIHIGDIPKGMLEMIIQDEEMIKVVLHVIGTRENSSLEFMALYDNNHSVIKYLPYFLENVTDKARFSKEFKDLVVNTPEAIKTLILSDNINKIMSFSDRFDEIKNYLSNEQKICIEYIKKYNNFFKDEKTLSELYQNYFSENNFCDNLFRRGTLSTLQRMYQANDPLIKSLNDIQIAVIDKYCSISDYHMQESFAKYIVSAYNEGNLDLDKIDVVINLMNTIEASNSSEIRRIKYELVGELLKVDDPVEKLESIKNIYEKNNLPTLGKSFLVFKTLNSSFERFASYEELSPVLKKYSDKNKDIIIFADLAKVFLGSNNRSMKEYLLNLKYGNEIYVAICNGQKSEADLNPNERSIIEKYVSHLNTLYNNTRRGKVSNNKVLTGNLMTDIMYLKQALSVNGQFDYNLPDRIVKMYFHFAGIDTLDEALNYFENVIKKANERNKSAAQKIQNDSNFNLEKGDLIKGIGHIDYLETILQNGSVAKDYLGSSSSSDRTPLDTDVSMILQGGRPIDVAINNSASRGYGPIYFVLKNRANRFSITRDSNNLISEKYDPNKLELFCTGACGDDHYGIRTGFASSEIDYIIIPQKSARVELEIVINGFYIPVVDRNGKLIFTPEEYDKLRDKMQGLSYYGITDYKISDKLISNDIEEYMNTLISNTNISNDTNIKRSAITKVIASTLEKYGLKVKNGFDGNLESGYAELIDTGSTGRGTNIPGDGDFDFIMRLDQNIIMDKTKLNEIKQDLASAFNIALDSNGDFRLKNVQIDGLSMPVDIDITFIGRTDKLEYSTDLCVRDRLETIRKQYPEQYNYVIMNILFAKKVLKEAGVYKPKHAKGAQGGLGGVGIENWILQNGGSFIDAVDSFLSASEGKTFDEFVKAYPIFDFGENHLAFRRKLNNCNLNYSMDGSDGYPHDNFTYNMDEAGYLKMISCLKQFKLYSDKNVINDEVHKIL